MPNSIYNAIKSFAVLRVRAVSRRNDPILMDYILPSTFAIPGPTSSLFALLLGQHAHHGTDIFSFVLSGLLKLGSFLLLA